MEYSLLGVAGALCSNSALAELGKKSLVANDPEQIPYNMKTNLTGSYGAWASELLGDKPGNLSYRNSRFQNVADWQKQALEKVTDLLAIPPIAGVPEVRVLGEYRYEGLAIQKLSWQLPYGPVTEAYYLKPEKVKAPLPGVVALHDHGGNKYFGKQKIVNTGMEKHPLLVRHQQDYYSGRAWANELAKQGYAVLVHDTFTFESRKVLLADVPEAIRMGVSDVGPDESGTAIADYNRWAANHEHVMAKSLFSAGTTWPGVFLADDQAALSILASRKEVDAGRLGCCGLSGGGLRSLLLGGIDQRIRAAVCVGMMSTWRDLLLYHSFTHTWMMFIPLMAREMEYSELFALQLPAPRMVLNNTEDALFEMEEMKRADKMLKEVYQKAGIPENYTCTFYPGIHKFDRPMQEDAFAWLNKWLAS